MRSICFMVSDDISILLQLTNPIFPLPDPSGVGSFSDMSSATHPCKLSFIEHRGIRPSENLCLAPSKISLSRSAARKLLRRRFPRRPAVTSVCPCGCPSFRTTALLSANSAGSHHGYIFRPLAIILMSLLQKVVVNRPPAIFGIVRRVLPSVSGQTFGVIWSSHSL